MISAGAALAMPSVAKSQEAPPPINVPTDPVPQGGTGTPQPPKPKPPQPAPPPATTKTPTAPPPAAGGGGAATGAAPGAATGATGGGDPKAIDNSGTFKISGTNDKGIVDDKGKKVQPGKPTGSAGPVATAAPKPPQKFIPVKKKEPLPIAEWPGFRMLDDGGSEVMIEFSKAVLAPSEHKAAGRYTFVFKGAVISKHNNKNPLLTIHFNTPVLDARLTSQKGGEIQLIVELRPGLDLAPVVGQRPASEGLGQQFFIRFPSGSYLPIDDDDYKTPDAKTEQGKASPKKDVKDPKDGQKVPSPATTTGTGAKTGPKP